MKQEIKKIPQFDNSTLNKRYFFIHLGDSISNVLIGVTVIALFFALFPVVYSLYSLFYGTVVIIFCIFLVLLTVGLILTAPNNIVQQLFGTVTNLKPELAFEVQRAGYLYIVISGFIFWTLLLILTIVDQGKHQKVKRIIALVISMVALITLLLSSILGGKPVAE